MTPSSTDSVKHTPGPWVLFRVGGDNGTVKALCPASEATKTSILSITEEDGATFAVVLKEGDAHLIAEAPNLLAELEHARSEASDACASLSSMALHGDVSRALRDAKEAVATLLALQSRLSAAISKATGEQS